MSIHAAEHHATTRERPRALTRGRACAELRGELGVYLLGAIAPEDRSTVESHLASCADCRGQLADLAGLPALLRRVPPDDVAGLVKVDGPDAASTLPDQPLRVLLGQVAKNRRSRAWSQRAVATAAAVVAGAAVAYAVLGTPRQHPPSQALPGAVTVRGTNPLDGVSAVVTYAPRPWGLQLDVQVEGITAGTRCVFDVTDASGRESEAGSWSVAASDKDAWYAASASVPLASVRGFVVTAGAQTLVRVAAPLVPRMETRLPARFS